jgi:hypothetical protein
MAATAPGFNSLKPKQLAALPANRLQFRSFADPARPFRLTSQVVAKRGRL